MKVICTLRKNVGIVTAIVAVTILVSRAGATGFGIPNQILSTDVSFVLTPEFATALASIEHDVEQGHIRDEGALAAAVSTRLGGAESIPAVIASIDGIRSRMRSLTGRGANGFGRRRKALDIPLGLDLYMPVPESHPLTKDRIALGRRLFHNKNLSRDRSIACASCHDPNRAFSTPKPISIGVFGRQGRRNVPAIVNRGYGRAFFWDGRTTILEEQVLRPIQDPAEMDLALDEATTRVNLSKDAIATALAAYVRSILTGNAPFDRYANGQRKALSSEQEAGLRIFRGKGNCTACHVGPNFSDERFHNTGVAWQNGRLQDEGRFMVTTKPEDRGAFKTPTLREVTRTSPYMHDGSLPTLEAVVKFYDEGGRPNPTIDSEIHPLKLTVDEKRALIAFLQSLSGRVCEGV